MLISTDKEALRCWDTDSAANALISGIGDLEAINFVDLESDIKSHNLYITLEFFRNSSR